MTVDDLLTEARGVLPHRPGPASRGPRRAGGGRLAGFDVLTAATGAEALRAAAAGQPDLILLDVMMPGSDGFEVIRGIRGGKPTSR